MALWGAKSGSEEKPKFLNDAQKKNCYATDRGWVTVNSRGFETVIVSIPGLASKLGAANLVGAEIVSRSSDDANLIFKLTFNEKVDIETPSNVAFQTVVDAEKLEGGTSNTANAVYLSGNNSTTLYFMYETLAGDNANSIILASNVISGTFTENSNTLVSVTANLVSAGSDGSTSIIPSLDGIKLIKE